MSIHSLRKGTINEDMQSSQLTTPSKQEEQLEIMGIAYCWTFSLTTMYIRCLRKLVNHHEGVDSHIYSICRVYYNIQMYHQVVLYC